MEADCLCEFENLRAKSIKSIQAAKEDGRKIVGKYCIYSPMEIVLAAGAIPIPLCSTKQDPIAAAEKVLPRNLCPLIKSSYGYAASGACPYFNASDLLIAETTCDGKKKMYELLSEIKPLHLLQLPQKQDKEALEYWYGEIIKLKDRLEEEFGVTITEQDLRKAIHLMNEERRSLKDFQDIAKLKPSPISGMDILMVLYNRGFSIDKEEAIALVDSLTSELKELYRQGSSPFNAKTPRLLLTGVPVGIGSHKVVEIIEASGGNVVCFESCGGYKAVYDQVDEEKPPLLAIAEKYLRTPCSCMSPNRDRYELLEQLVDEFKIDGVVDLTWQACHTYNIESHSLKKYLQTKKNCPFLQIETDYSESDIGQLRVRIEAFIEMIASA
ncbi:Benzoyl-CoA reductase/2-hydroxyglutaryl-CoA dehydratase subunit, BcrC/BadD/HgdB [Desulfosporosinus orientis DSM 765]|uniref:Benzoyl-CoA reductase/2-hydroxyglutaryl-CoA dehydratase subunit, BcrC/BadD/HgdB n=1 Tax=Desulfosporosinus orientis (strain ATCC 19365 / DSM 765 / NCIMB 8382 / VKM B-1628 / Singapore I) TaxID=768706 RepID=G7WFF0_DESOD|nr:double-cubane-cluster-containing anaerobic reductase [Desulfosporosinus orientis]AET68393.1 Benzoyl-CoA reductase/2-hydroxyglutaryl-CoA dehydratase subunit, BcrC/BadD/HgdB [Desulfosporosinus orientis DSM 765]